MTGTQIAGAGTDSVPVEPLVYRIPVAGLVLGGISRRKVSDLIAEGELEVVPVAGIRMVTRASIEAYLERQKDNAAELQEAVNRTAAARRKQLAAA